MNWKDGGWIPGCSSLHARLAVWCILILFKYKAHRQKLLGEWDMLYTQSALHAQVEHKELDHYLHFSANTHKLCFVNNGVWSG